MARRFGADSSPYQDLSLPLVDAGGRIVISTDDTYGSSPMGVSLREQVLFGLPNATFNLLPPDPAAAIDQTNNPLPFWSIQTTENISATPNYDTTTQTWGIKIDPGTAPSGDYITLSTRSWVTTDDNLALRQRASLTLAKGGTYAGTTQWNATLTAEYFGHDNLSLASYTIGTVYDNTTWTSISGTTTAGGSAIATAASWVEFTMKLTATQNITSSTFVTLQSLLLATSTAASGAFVVTDTFNASSTWTRPTGVTSLVAVVGVGGGGGGASGSAMYNNTVNADANAIGGPGGGSSAWAIIRDLYVGDVGSVSVGIGTAGVGGTATTLTKAATITTMGTAAIVAGGAGGATTFGTYLTIPGGGGGGVAAGGTAAGVPTSTMYGLELLGSVVGTAGANGAAGSASTFRQLPYWQSFAAGVAGGSATNSLNTAGTATTTAGGVAGSAGIIGGGAGGGSARYNSSSDATVVGAGFIGGYGAGSGGGASAVRFTAISTAVSTGGTGGSAAANSGAGGGGGGGAHITAYPKSGAVTNYNASTLTVTAGAGGNGGAGRLYVVYVA